MSVYFTEDHEWVSVDGDVGTVGISDYAAKQLGDVVYVELAEVGRTVAKGDDTSVVESVKAASDVYTPVSGEVVGANEALEDAPETVNESAEDAGWFFKIKLSDPSELEGLMDATKYKTYCDGL
ncbi:MAG: glycine cleavage system protein GcvH [Maricaulaceae bacterium]